MDKRQVKELMDDLNAKRFRRGEDWKGYKVFIPVYKGSPVIGLPLVVLANDDEVRISTDSESLEYLDFSTDRQNGKRKIIEWEVFD